VAWAIRTGRADLLLDALLQEPIAPDFRHRFEAIKASVELFEYFPGEGYLEAPERIQAFYHCLLLDYSPEELARVVKYALGQELYAVAERSPFQATVYSLLAWTNEQGSFAKLAQAAAQDKPQSSSLQEFYKSYRLERLARGICAAYPSRDALAMMLDFDLSVDLNAVTSKPDLGGAVQEVLAWADNQALIERFCAAAQAENPTNPVLKKEVAYYLAGTGQSLDMPVSSAGLSVVTAQAEASPMAGPGVGATDGPRHAMLHAALVAMTGSIDDLAILVGYGLGDDLHTLGGEGSLGVLAYRLICWAEASGRLDELAAAALRRVSANPEIQAYVECYPLPDQEIPQPELGRQRAELHSAILGVVEYQYDDLAMLVDYELGEDAYSLTREGSLHTQVYRLIRWAEQNDRLDELVAAALHFNPSNEQIQAYVEQYPLPHHEVPQSKLGRQRAALHHALVAAFDLPGLRLLVQRQLGNEHELVWRDSPRTFGYELIRWAEVNGRYADLVAAAVAEAPDHPAIQAYLAEYP
jgi:hypothetical protein